MERNMDFIEELKERFLRYVAFDYAERSRERDFSVDG